MRARKHLMFTFQVLQMFVCLLITTHLLKSTCSFSPVATTPDDELSFSDNQMSDVDDGEDESEQVCLKCGKTC